MYKISLVKKSHRSICAIGINLFLVLSIMGISMAQECVSCERTAIPDYLRSITPNTTLMNDRTYRQVVGTAYIYDTPNGNLIRTISEGFNFVTVAEQANGWVRINQGEWMRADNVAYTNPVSAFTGFLFETEADYDAEDVIVAWALVNMYPSRIAGGVPDESQNLIYRYTPLTINHYEVVDDIRWYQVGKNQWVHQHRVAKIAPLQEKPPTVTTDIWIAIDLYEQVLIAYDDVTPVFATLIATGLPRWPTFEGTFNIYYRTPRKDMTWGVVGDDFYFLQEVPWTMFFDDGRALHGAYWHDGLGYRRSHGCVNMSITDAKWLYDWVAESMGSRASANIEEGPNVYVYSSGEYQ